jgi:hypothetical protein
MGQVEGVHRRVTGFRNGDSGRRSVTGVRQRGSCRTSGIWGEPRLDGVQLRAMAVEFPVVHGHPNRLPFEGVLTLLDVASDKAPSGARGHRVVLTREAAEAALPSLLGMAVDYKAGWDGHDARQKCGIITSAEVVGLKLSEAIAADALLPQTALNAPGNVLANLQQLQVVSSTGTALQLDAGMAPPAGGGFEVRRGDWDFGPGVDQDLVLRSPVRSFSIPREGQVERYYVRMFDGSTPPVYSRFSSAVFTDLPVS